MAEANGSPTSGRFIPLSTHHLTSEPPLSETTLPSLLARSEQLAAEAREALPYSFDKCTYDSGYLRQSVWSCVDCGEKGVCYGCSISCHADHKLVELWTKRHFRCDCPTTAMPVVNGKRKKCTLNPPHAQPQPWNEENKYGSTFAGKFCRCGRDYDPETEVEAMVTCIACEDWFHESCLNLSVLGTAEGKEDDEDEEKDVLIPSESYDGLICAACVDSHPLLKEHAGKPGWMVIEPRGTEGYEVVGRLDTEQRDTEQRDTEQHDTEGKEAGKADEDKQALGKRPADDDLTRDGAKRARVGEQTSLEGKKDVFLAHGIREQLKSTLSAEVIASLPFPLDDEEIYEPPQDDEQEETLDQVTSRVVGSLPRVQAIEALHGYQVMKDRLKAMLAERAHDGRAVSREDIEGFFAELQAGRARG